MASPNDIVVHQALFEEIANFTRNGGPWIFDLDGTLTRPQHDFAALRLRLGLSPDVCLVDAMQTGPEERARWIAQEIATWEWELSLKASVAPGVRPLLQWLRDQDCSLGIVTRNLRPVALQTLETIGLTDLIPASWVLGREEAQAKPSPDGIRWLLRQWGASQAVMVGDYIHDLEAGRNAGVYTIHVGPAPRPEWAAYTDLYIREFSELLSALSKIAC